MHDDRYFRVVVNAGAQLALWPVGRPPPRGWRTTAMAGTRERCCDYIDLLTPESADQLPGVRVPGAGGGAAGAAQPQRLPPEPSIIRMIDRFCRRTPRAPALTDGRSQLSFGELGRRCAAVATQLVAAGVGRGHRVVVCLPPGIDFVIALIGVLKAGAVGVPLVADAGWQHRDAVLAGSRASAEVTAAGVRRLDHDPGVVLPAAGGQALLLYPPGGGRSQAVVWEHRQLTGLAAVAALAAVVGRSGASAGVGPRVAVHHSPDSPLLPVELAWSLGTGTEAVVLAGGVDAAAVRRHRLATVLVDLPAPLPGQVTARLWRAGSTPAVTMLSGFPETAAVCALGASSHGPGRPLPGVRFLVLDPELAAVPPGGIGSLYVSGWAVGGGYGGGPGSSARRLLPDPSGPPGSRMFDTGIPVRRDGTDLVSFEPP